MTQMCSSGSQVKGKEGTPQEKVADTDTTESADSEEEGPTFMHPSKETLNSPSSRVDADSTSRRRRILRCIFSGVGES